MGLSDKDGSQFRNIINLYLLTFHIMRMSYFVIQCCSINLYPSLLLRSISLLFHMFNHKECVCNININNRTVNY